MNPIEIEDNIRRLEVMGLTCHGNPPSFEAFMKQLRSKGTGTLRPFMAFVWPRPEFGIVEIALEDVPCHHEWIKGEGADMSIWRALDDDRVVGATLPLRVGPKADVEPILLFPDATQEHSPKPGPG
jgi:hypothetical protein